jgi:hypothetical protein
MEDLAGFEKNDDSKTAIHLDDISLPGRRIKMGRSLNR